MTQDFHNQPQYGGYPHQQPYPQGGAMPYAPTRLDGPVTRPGVVTSSAVLAFVQAGITAITTILVLAGAAGALGDGHDEAALTLVVGIAQLAGVLLLLFGGIRLLKGTGRGALVGGSAVEIAISLFYLVAFTIVPTFGVEALQGAKAFLVFVALLFAVMPVISMIQALGAASTEWLRARSAR